MKARHGDRALRILAFVLLLSTPTVGEPPALPEPPRGTWIEHGKAFPRVAISIRRGGLTYLDVPTALAVGELPKPKQVTLRELIIALDTSRRTQKALHETEPQVLVAADKSTPWVHLEWVLSEACLLKLSYFEIDCAPELEALSRVGIRIRSTSKPGCDAVIRFLGDATLKIGKDRTAFAEARAGIAALEAKGQRVRLVPRRDTAWKDVVHVVGLLRERKVAAVEIPPLGDCPRDLRNKPKLPRGKALMDLDLRPKVHSLVLSWK